MSRDYNEEMIDSGRENEKYLYGFDGDVMEKYLFQDFKTFLLDGSCIELGCSAGVFTRRIIPYFKNMVCVDASGEAIKIAENLFKDSDTDIEFICAKFEELQLTQSFDNVFLTHVLEHIDDRMSLLRKIHNEIISDNGRLFCAVPNANSPSRRLAAKMGLLNDVTDVMKHEYEHGHRVTYTMHTFERDLKEAGFKIVAKSGVFFKPLASFQMDRVIKDEIVDDRYLDACYELGHEFPDFSASIYCICEK